jgi:predicted ribosome quality control (RQC) complex YloA/Tae2 family protein
MIQSWFFLSRLAATLDKVLKGAILESVFSQQKDELVLAFTLINDDSFFFKAELQQGIGLLSFPESFQRSRGNSVDLFPQIIGFEVLTVKPVLFDRSFHIEFKEGLQLCFKMYGGKSNVLLHDGKQTSDIFNHHLKKDLDIPPPEDLNLLLPEFGKYTGDQEWLKNHHPMIGKEIWGQWEKWQSANQKLDGQSSFTLFLETLQKGKLYVCQIEKQAFVTCFPEGEILLESENPIDIANRFQKAFWGINRFEKEKELRINHWEKKIHQIKNQIQVAENQILTKKESESYQVQADLLMAYGFQIKKGENSVLLPHFSEDKMVEIKLKSDLSVPENAERFYRKAKGEKENEQRLEDRLRHWEERLDQTKEEYRQILEANQWADLKPFSIQPTKQAEEEEALPYWQKLFLDFEIWIGKNAKANDEMLRMAHKDDLWLHARDVPGSHVIVRKKKANVIPKPVMEKAAQWAAYFSKSKNESLVPVMITERKYVRKIKGTAAGLVKVEREKTILVSPEA